MSPISPIPFLDLFVRGSHLFIEAQTVIALRLLGLAGLWPVGDDESRRMVSEKGPAWAEAASAAQGAAFAGARADEVMLAAIGPLSREARSNRTRLLRRR